MTYESIAPPIKEQDITVLIKTMDRPKCLNNLVSSIRNQVCMRVGRERGGEIVI